jgi:hypothetical protein
MAPIQLHGNMRYNLCSNSKNLF